VNSKDLPVPPDEKDRKESLPAVVTVNNEPGLSDEENLLLNSRLPHDLDPKEMEAAWSRYQAVIGKLLARMGAESKMLDSIARLVYVRTFDGVYARLALIPKLGQSALHAYGKHGLGELVYRLAGELTLMELSAAAGYRTFCFPDLIRGLLKSGKMRDKSINRMMDTFEFLNTMCQHPINDPLVLQQLERTNGLHAKYKVAGAGNQAAADLFKYIALNMFYIGPRMRPDLTPDERHAICGLTVLVAKRMGHTIAGTVKELEAFIEQYEANNMFGRDDRSALRARAIEIARASRVALDQLPTISPARIHGYVPYRVKKILELD
jgi:hypothetical protein